MVLYFFSQVSELEDGHVKIIEFLANEVSDPLEANDEEETPYHILANAENGLKSIKFLVNLTRSNPIKFDKNHESPLHIAAKFGNLGMAFLWKIQDFSITQILCGINFGESESCKTAFLPFLGL